MASKEDCDEDLIFADRNRSTLELYINGVNTHDVTIGPDNRIPMKMYLSPTP